MAQFIEGLLKDNIIRGEYEGMIFAREPILQHKNGTILHIFDYSLISSELPLGEKYEFVIACAIASTPQIVEHAGVVEDSLQSGMVVELKWCPRNSVFQRLSPELYKDVYGNERTWILVNTALGSVLLSDARLHNPVQEGDYLKWQNIRLDLMAIV